MAAKKLCFDTEGVKEHYEELQRQHWLKEGRREVVEFVEREYGYFTDDGLAKIIIDDGGYYGDKGSIAKWKSRKKEWGID